MNLDEIAAKFDNRTGYRVIDRGHVGLPVYKLTVVALTLERKRLDPISEFVLRAANLGLVAVGDIAGLLGLSTRVVDSTVAELVRSEQVTVVADSDRHTLALTDRGTRLVKEQEEIKPAEQSFVFTYDGLIRRPKWYGDTQLYTPRELRDAGIPEIRPIPARPPELHELDVGDIADVVSLIVGRADSPLSLLNISRIERRIRLFKDAVALAYRSDDGEIVQVAFALDGRMSEVHGQAFAEGNGLQKNQLFRSLHLPPSDQLVKDVLDDDLAQRVSSPEGQSIRSQLARARGQEIQAKAELARADSAGDEQQAADRVKNAKQRVSELVEGTIADEVRPVEVYEHADILQEALEQAHTRLLIISPWLRASVITRLFLQRVERLLARHVKVFIGYGLGEVEQDERPWDKKARNALESLAARHDNFVLTRLGDTHAKVLIKDDEFFVISSFNWLSFKGDRKRTFREEMGTLVRIPERVNQLFDRMAGRFESDDPHSRS